MRRQILAEMQSAQMFLKLVAERIGQNSVLDTAHQLVGLFSQAESQDLNND